jgi:hypothetical protein
LIEIIDLEHDGVLQETVVAAHSPRLGFNLHLGEGPWQSIKPLAENVIWPICKSEAEAINVGLFDGIGFRCKTHGEFEVADSAVAMHIDTEVSMGGRS